MSRSAGQIIKKGPRVWLVRIYLGEDPTTGRRKYHNKTIRGSKKEAQSYLTGALRDKDLGRFAEPTRMTLNEFFQKWLNDVVQHRLRERSFDDYSNNVRRYIRDTIGNIRLDRVTALGIQSLYTEMITQQGLSTGTLRKLHVVLSSGLDQAVRWGLIPFNPSRSVQLPRDNQRREEKIKAMTPEEANRFLEAAKLDRWYCLFALALSTGMRPSEYLALQWADIDWETGNVTVERALFRPRGGGWRFESPKTKHSRRKILLPAGLLEELRAHQEGQEQQRSRPDYTDHDLIFATSNGEPVDAHNLRRRHFRPILVEAGLDTRFNLYSLRHSHTSILVAAGVSVKTISSRLGHSSVRLTLDVYSHVMPTMQEEAAEKLDSLLFDSDAEG